MPTLLLKFTDSLDESIRIRYRNKADTGLDSGYDLYFPNDGSSGK